MFSIHCECGGLLDFHCNSITLHASNEEKASTSAWAWQWDAVAISNIAITGSGCIWLSHMYVWKSLINNSPAWNQGWANPRVASSILMAAGASWVPYLETFEQVCSSRSGVWIILKCNSLYLAGPHFVCACNSVHGFHGCSQRVQSNLNWILLSEWV